MKKILIFICITCLFLTGCDPMNPEIADDLALTESNLEPIAKSSPQQLNHHIKVELTDYISVDAELYGLTQLEQYKVPDIIVREHHFELEKVFDKLCDVVGVKRDDNVKIEKGSDTLVNGESVECISQDFPNGMLAVLTTYIMLSKEWNSKLDYMIETHPTIFYNKYDLKTMDQELSFARIEDCEQQARSLCEEFGIDILQERTCYSYSVDLLNQIKNNIENYEEIAESNSFDPEVEKKDEMYIFEFMQGYNEIPILSNDVNDEIADVCVPGCYCDVAYTVDGLKSFNTGQIYDVLDVDEEHEILSLDKILKIYREDMQKKYGNKDIVVGEIGLNYRLNLKDKDKVEMVGTPVWYIVYECMIENSGGYEYNAQKKCVYDAVTGENYDVEQ